MKLIKKYSAIKVETKEKDRMLNVKLTYGTTGSLLASSEYPTQYHDTEDDAIKWAYDKDRYSNWLIVPLIRFDWFSDDVS